MLTINRYRFILITEKLEIICPKEQSPNPKKESVSKVPARGQWYLLNTNPIIVKQIRIITTYCNLFLLNTKDKPRLEVKRKRITEEGSKIS
ncbi:hypothetical protein ES705_28183 [subsurface metagenome]